MEKQKKVRLDVLVVKQGLAESREKAQAMIMAGEILSGNQKLEKPGIKIPEDAVLRRKGDGFKYVSRGALKLLGALDSFNEISLKDKVCLDVGASTGGFTEVCLERGAKIVYSVDVGHNQLHWKLRSDHRVKSFEGVNMRNAKSSILPERVDFVCIDASFISLKLLLPNILTFMHSRSELVALIKPQHEVGPENVGKGGIVSDSKLHEEVKKSITEFSEYNGFKVKGLIESPIKGTTGNKEFLIYLTLGM